MSTKGTKKIIGEAHHLKTKEDDEGIVVGGKCGYRSYAFLNYSASSSSAAAAAPPPPSRITTIIHIVSPPSLITPTHDHHHCITTLTHHAHARSPSSSRSHTTPQSLPSTRIVNHPTDLRRRNWKRPNHIVELQLAVVLGLFFGLLVLSFSWLLLSMPWDLSYLNHKMSNRRGICLHLVSYRIIVIIILVHLVLSE